MLFLYQIQFLAFVLIISATASPDRLLLHLRRRESFPHSNSSMQHVQPASASTSYGIESPNTYEPSGASSSSDNVLSSSSSDISNSLSATAPTIPSTWNSTSSNNLTPTPSGSWYSSCLPRSTSTFNTTITESLRTDKCSGSTFYQETYETTKTLIETVTINATNTSYTPPLTTDPLPPCTEAIVIQTTERLPSICLSIRGNETLTQTPTLTETFMFSTKAIFTATVISTKKVTVVGGISAEPPVNFEPQPTQSDGRTPTGETNEPVSSEGAGSPTPPDGPAAAVDHGSSSPTGNEPTPPQTESTPPVVNEPTPSAATEQPSSASNEGGGADNGGGRPGEGGSGSSGPRNSASNGSGSEASGSSNSEGSRGSGSDLGEAPESSTGGSTSGVTGSSSGGGSGGSGSSSNDVTSDAGEQSGAGPATDSGSGSTNADGSGGRSGDNSNSGPGGISGSGSGGESSGASGHTESNGSGSGGGSDETLSSIITVEGLTFAANPTEVVIDDSTTYQIRKGETPTTAVVNGQTVSLGPDGIGFPTTAVPVPEQRGGPQPSVYTLGGLTILVNPTEAIISGTTYPIGSARSMPLTTVINGQTVSFGSGGVGLPTITVPVPNQTGDAHPSVITAHGITFSVDPTEAIISGTTYPIGSGAIPTTTVIDGQTVSFGPGGVGLPTTTIAPPSPGTRGTGAGDIQPFTGGSRPIFGKAAGKECIMGILLALGLGGVIMM